MAGKTMKSRKHRAPVFESVRVRGFCRVQAGVRDKKSGRLRIVGDSGWIKNTITNDGRNSYIAATVGAVAGSKVVSHLQLASQSTAVDATQQSLSSETRVRKALTASGLL